MKTSFSPIILAIITLLASTLTACNTQSPTVVSTSQTLQTQKALGIWIDVRGADEYNTGHLSGSYNIVPDELADRIASIEPNKDAPIHLYCRSGRRAETARQILLDLGYTNVTNHGGYQELYDKGLR